MGAVSKPTVQRPKPTVPLTYEEALASPYCREWQAAMQQELDSLKEYETWALVQPPRGARVIGSRWIFDLKEDQHGNVVRFKARLVVRGFQARPGVDYGDTFAPTSIQKSLRAFLAVVAERDLELEQTDIKTAFLNGELEETVYIQQPLGFEQGGPGVVCQLAKALYGLPQAPRAWYQKLNGELSALGFEATDADPTLYVRRGKDGDDYVLVHVDDMLIAGSSPAAVARVKAALGDLFEVKDLGAAQFFLGMEITRDRAARTLKLTQQKYSSEVLQRFGMADAKPSTLPLGAGVKLQKEGVALPSDDAAVYGAIIGSLMYLSTSTRPDMAQAVGALARYSSAPTEAHMSAAKQLLRYLRGTAAKGIQFGGGAGLEGFCDSDFAGELDKRRSTTGYVFTLNGGAISWSSKLQPTVAASTAEAEYMAAAAATKEALWMRKLLAVFGVEIETVGIKGDNQACLRMIKHSYASPRSKHIDVMHHFVRERAKRGEVSFSFVGTSENVADALTKPVPVMKFRLCMSGMGLI
jgi:hypothetical protein